ncbi:MAG TPA: dihydroxyacetone kinase subunit DhaL [Actinomycetota bacterium]|nr:dihydroxyacetone kinase subunit DhaL [Actinomycetota bacterium]
MGKDLEEVGRNGLGVGRPERLDGAFVARWIDDVARQIHRNRDYLTQLDAAIGDADHGVNMDRGFAAALRKIDEDASRPPGALLEVVGTTLVMSVGGAAGPLYGSAIRQMGRSLDTSETFDAEDLLVLLRAALEEIQRLGAAQPGDKTIVDALVPAIDAFERGLRSGEDFATVAGRARAAAEEGMRSTVPLHARKGRASYLGPRSVGHQDPGATSTALLFTALERTASGGDA